MLKTFLQVNQQLARKMTFTCTLGFSVNSALVFGKFSMRNKCVREKKGHIKLTFTTLVEGVAFWQQLLVWGYSAVPRGQIHFIGATPTSSSSQRQGKHLSHSPRRTCLGVLDFFVSTCISDSLLRARACLICCWIILKFVHCMIYPISGWTR